VSRQVVLAVQTKTYNVWLNKTLGPIPWWGWWPVSDSKHVPVTWDPDKTKITSAKLMVDATATRASILDIKVNGTPAVSLSWDVLEEGARKEATGDVSSSLLNGDNLFFATLSKMVGSVWESSATFTATLVVEFEGEPPDVREKPDWQVWLEQNWPYVALAGGVVVLGGVAYGLARAKR
jgi:hypothetical protein